MNTIRAPFTPEEVEALNRYQSEGRFHPFTCGNDRGDAAHREYQKQHGGDFGQLIATTDGWICPVCDYRQDWAHDFMATPLSSASSSGPPNENVGFVECSACTTPGDCYFAGECPEPPPAPPTATEEDIGKLVELIESAAWDQKSYAESEHAKSQMTTGEYADTHRAHAANADREAELLYQHAKDLPALYSRLAQLKASQPHAPPAPPHS